jgi:tetratricopeptide (TPR) repeat protein
MMRPEALSGPQEIASDALELSVAQDQDPVLDGSHPHDPVPRRAPTRGLSVVALLAATALALSPLWSGYYGLGAWAPLALGMCALLVAVALRARPRFTRYGLIATGALTALLMLSAASLIWAESKDSAWTATNTLALYAVIFSIGVLTVRDRQTARATMLILGAPALLTSLAVALAMVGGGAHGAFVAGRLNAPMGYINATAGLLVMGMWPWLGLAETADRRLIRVLAMCSCTLIAGTAVLTQSRAIVPALLTSTALALAAAPGRTRRALHLIVILAAVVVSLHWTLAVYRSTGSAQLDAIPNDALRRAGLALLVAALLAGGAKFALSALWLALAPTRRARALALLGPALAAGAAIAVAALTLSHSSTIRRDYRVFVEDGVSRGASDRFLYAGGYRYDLWRVAVLEFEKHPFGGVGAGNYDDEYYRLRRNPQYVIAPHSIELQLAAELGVGGLLALVVLCAAIVAAGFARRGTVASADPLLKVGALGMFAAWLTATSVDWLYDFPGLTGAALLAGTLLLVPTPASRPGAGGSGSARGRHRPREVVLLIAAAASILAAASIGRQYAASRYASAGASRIYTAPIAAIGTLRTAEELDPYSLPTLYSIASAYAYLGDYADARSTLLKAQRLEPDNYVPPTLLGDLATRRGAWRVAVSEYSLAQKLDPRDSYIRGLVAAGRRRFSSGQHDSGATFAPASRTQSGRGPHSAGNG